MNHLSTLEHHYQDPERPFGFIFDHSDEPEAPLPEVPAAGEPLLNDIELNHTNQFFDRLQNDFDFWDDQKLVESFSMFHNESLPSFQGISVTLPQSAHSLDSPIQNIDFTTYGHDLTTRLGQTQLVSPTVAEHPALHTLNHFGLSRQAHQDTLDSKQNVYVFKTQELFEQTQELRNAASRVVSTNNGPGKDAKPAQTKSGSFQSGDVVNMASDASGEGRRRPLPPVSFGSDLDFHSQQYNSSKSHIIDLKNREAIFQENLKTFESKWSGESTASSSPTTATKRNLSHLNEATAAPFPAVNNNMNRQNVHSFGDEGSKRAKKMKHEEPEDGTDDSNSGSGRQSANIARRQSSKGKPKVPKQKTRTLSESNVMSCGGNRRRSIPAESKAPRQNLTEEEKKQNHIRSEQKRRNQIREGFANLTTMMPDASSANLSKCAILSHAVDWLEGLIEGNEKLRAQLDSMGG